MQSVVFTGSYKVSADHRFHRDYILFKHDLIGDQQIYQYRQSHEHSLSHQG